QTAEACLQAYGEAATPQVLPGLDEYDHHEIVVRFQPRYANRELMLADLAESDNPRRAFQAMFTQAVARWVSGKHDGDYSESWPAFRARCLQALDTIIEALPASGTALVFTSGGPISAVAQTLLGVPDAHAARFSRLLAHCGDTKVTHGIRGTHPSPLTEHGQFQRERQDLITDR